MLAKGETIGGLTALDSTFVVKDSGVREEYISGMRRDTQEGKVDYTLIPLEFLERFAKHLTAGAAKYGRENWRLANSHAELIRFKSSAFRHFIQWLRGDRDEDHAAAVAFNLAAAEMVMAKLASTPTTPTIERTGEGTT